MHYGDADPAIWRIPHLSYLPHLALLSPRIRFPSRLFPRFFHPRNISDSPVPSRRHVDNICSMLSIPFFVCRGGDANKYNGRNADAPQGLVRPTKGIWDDRPRCSQTSTGGQITVIHESTVLAECMRELAGLV
ncbi:hypothetical protein AcV7_009401 [Taiwanofungus camphoratus]|nr:hypothetical protein AcV7_009401 [Antrodia cinnamomea]